jgi:hypothetical protein
LFGYWFVWLLIRLFGFGYYRYKKSNSIFLKRQYCNNDSTVIKIVL